MMMHQDELGIYDIYTVIYTPFWQRVWIKWSLLFFGLMIILFLSWWLTHIFIFSRKRKSVPTRQIVLQKLKQINDVGRVENVRKLYADLGFVLRLFFTDWHERDMLSLTENEIVAHLGECIVCTEQFNHCVIYVKNNVSLNGWREEMSQLLGRMSDVKYKAEISLNNESIMNDISLVTTLIHSVYFKK
jgi:hypothetical protein